MAALSTSVTSAGSWCKIGIPATGTAAGNTAGASDAIAGVCAIEGPAGGTTAGGTTAGGPGTTAGEDAASVWAPTAGTAAEACSAHSCRQQQPTVVLLMI